MRPAPVHEPLERAVQPVQIRGEHVVGERGAVRPPFAQPVPPAHGLRAAAGKEHRRRRLGRGPRAHQEAAPVRRRAHDALRLQDPHHAPGGGRAIRAAPEPEGPGGLGQHRRHHREPVRAQHQIAEPVDARKRSLVPVQHPGDLPAAAGEPRPCAEAERRRAHCRPALVFGERGRGLAGGLGGEQRLQGRGRRVIARERGHGTEARREEKAMTQRAHAPSPGGVQSRRTVRRPASTVSAPAPPA